MTEELLGNDLVINEDSCNLSCEYCLTGQSNLKLSHREQLIFQPPSREEYSDDSPLGQRLRQIVGRIDGTFKTPFLKVTGGEIFLVKGIMKFLEQVSQTHEVLVIQTNGVLIRDEQLAQLRGFGNVVMQISLDSHLFSGNSYRVHREDLHFKIISKVEKIINSGLPVEVYSVLNNRSISEMEPFVDWLMQFPEPPVYMPFPIRGPNSERFAPRKDQTHHVERFVERLDDFEAILPPRAYFERLLRMLREGERTFRCHLPRLVLSTFSDGMVTACPNIWFSDMGNVLADDWDRTAEKVGGIGLYQALLSPQPRLDACKGCYTPWDLLSMYFDDEITLDELCKSPTYAPPNIRTLIETKKVEYKRGERHAIA